MNSHGADVPAAIILAGGRSSRMGTDKAWLDYDGKPLISHVTENLASLAAPIIVVAAPNQSLPALAPTVTVARDDTLYPGPLAALATGLRAARSAHPQAEYAWLAGVDMPFVAASVVDALTNLARGFAYAMVELGGYRQYLGAIYAVSLLPGIDALLKSGVQNLGAIAALQGGRIVTGAELQAVQRVAAEDPTLRTYKDWDIPSDVSVR